MWLTPGRASGRKKRYSKTLHDGKTKTWALYNRTNYDGVQPDVLHRGRAVMACQRSKSQEVRVAVMDVVFSVCIVMRGAVGARVWEA